MMIKLTESEKLVLDYLRANAGFYSPTNINNAVRSKRYIFESSWASRNCKKLVAKGLAERNERGHYKAKEEP